MATHLTDAGAHADRDLRISGRFAAGRDVHIYEGAGAARPDYRLEIRQLVGFYTEVFVGRDDTIERCQRFAGDAPPGYMLIEADPAHGKSALIAQLFDRADRGDWGGRAVPDTIAFFVREEGQRDTPSAFLTAVNAQLLDLLDLSGGVPGDMDAARNQFSWLWSQAGRDRSAQSPLLLLIDGLDEMAAGRLTVAHLLPGGLDDFVHVIVASRPNPEPLKTVSHEHPLRKAQVQRLNTFGLTEIESLLAQHGADTGLAARVLATTRGEPLLARFVCEDVGVSGERALVGVEEDPPDGVRDYFEWQFRQLAARAEGEVARQSLAVLLCSRGPMSAAELAGVLGVAPRTVSRALEPVWRFLVGDDRLELMHLELRAALLDDFSKDEIESARASILGWCAAYRDQGWPPDTPGYVLEHYADHLADAADAAALAALVTREWMELKFERLRTHASFAADVRAVLEVAGRTRAHVNTDELRHWFLLACLASAATDVPGGALAAMAASGAVGRAEGYARLAASADQAAAFGEIAAVLLDQGVQRAGEAMLADALETARVIADAEGRGEAFLAIVMALLGAGLKPRAAAVVRDADLAGAREMYAALAYIFAAHEALADAAWCIAQLDAGVDQIDDDVMDDVASFAALAEVRIGRTARAFERLVAVHDAGSRWLVIIALLGADLGEADRRRVVEVAEAELRDGDRTDGQPVARWLLGQANAPRAALAAESADHRKLALDGAASLLVMTGHADLVLAFVDSSGATDAEQAHALVRAAAAHAEFRLAADAVRLASVAYDRFGDRGTGLGTSGLGELAWAFARAGDLPRSQVLVDAALAASFAISDYERSELLRNLAAALAGAGAWNSVRAAITADAYSDDAAVRELVATLLFDGRAEQAATATTLARPQPEVVEALAERGDLAMAEQLVAREPAGWDRAQMISRIAIARARTQPRDAVMEYVEKMRREADEGYSFHRSDYLAGIAYAAARVGENAVAESALAEVEGPEAGASDQLYGETRGLVAAAVALLEDPARAEAARARVPSWAALKSVRWTVVGLVEMGREREAAEALSRFRAWNRTELIVGIATSLCHAGRHREALALIPAPGDNDDRLQLVATVVEYLSGAGDVDAALDVLAGSDVEQSRLPRLSVTAGALAERGDHAQARALSEGLVHDEPRAAAILAVAERSGDAGAIRAGLTVASRNGRRSFVRALRAAPSLLGDGDAAYAAFSGVLEWWTPRQAAPDA